jgi:hypothetical protein
MNGRLAAKAGTLELRPLADIKQQIHDESAEMVPTRDFMFKPTTESRSSWDTLSPKSGRESRSFVPRAPPAVRGASKRRPSYWTSPTAPATAPPRCDLASKLPFVDRRKNVENKKTSFEEIDAFDDCLLVESIPMTEPELFELL